MLCQFRVYSKVIQLYIYVYLFWFNFFSHLGYYRISSRVPCAIQQVLVGYLFQHWYFIRGRNLGSMVGGLKLRCNIKYFSDNFEHPRAPKAKPRVFQLSPGMTDSPLGQFPYQLDKLLQPAELFKQANHILSGEPRVTLLVTATFVSQSTCTFTLFPGATSHGPAQCATLFSRRL